MGVFRTICCVPVQASSLVDMIQESQALLVRLWRAIESRQAHTAEAQSCHLRTVLP